MDEIIGYILIPHQKDALFFDNFEWIENNPPSDLGDNYYDGDHDLHGIIQLKDIEDLFYYRENYEGHQKFRVRIICDNLLVKLFNKESIYELQEI